MRTIRRIPNNLLVDIYIFKVPYHKKNKIVTSLHYSLQSTYLFTGAYAYTFVALLIIIARNCSFLE